MSEIVERYRRLVREIKLICESCGRNPNEVKIVAATKHATAEQIRELAENGLEIAGENRVQELLEKRSKIDDVVKWHFIGHLQKNKVGKIVGFIAMIHSLDSFELALEISRRASQADRVVDVLVQVNVSGEQSKHGVRPEEVTALVQRASELPNIRVVGLMTMAPLTPEEAVLREVFRSLRGIKEELNNIGYRDIRELSMGMTNDYRYAIEEGSTMVRIGSAIFG